MHTVVYLLSLSHRRQTDMLQLIDSQSSNKDIVVIVSTNAAFFGKSKNK